jgi:hypothetical protein
MSILGGGIVGRCERKSLLKHVSNSEWLPRYSCLNLQNLTSLDFFFLWSWMKSAVYKRRGNKRDEMHACILDASVCIKRLED